MTIPLLGCRDLTCGRGGRAVLRGVDLSIEPAQSWLVAGPNGAGKSTLIATLLGTLAPLGGEVLPALCFDRRGLGFVPQESPVVVPLPVTVAEFVGAGLAGIRSPQPEAAIQQALLQLGIEALATQDLRRLSVGQRRRAFVARALVREPRLLVLDEPLANLDPGTAERLCSDLDRLRVRWALTVVHVGHELALARRFATHVAFVADGSVQSGPTAAVWPAVAAWAEGRA